MTQERLLSIINSVSSDGYYRYGSIPSKKMASAYANYNVDQSDTILALIDCSVFGSAKTGAAIGQKGIYWKNDWTNNNEHNYISWKELSSDNRKISKSTFDINLGAGKTIDMSGSSMKKEEFIHLIVQLVNLYRETPFENMGVPSPELVAATTANTDKSPQEPNIIEGGAAVGGSIVGTWYLWTHRPIENAADFVSRGITDPNFFVFKENFFYIGLVLMAVLFFYGLKKLRIIK